VGAELCAEVEAVAQRFSRHLELHYVPEGSLTPDETPPGWPPPDPAEVRARGAAVRQVLRRPDGVGVLALDGLDSVHLAAPFVDAAFELLRGAHAVVIDLRANGGGDMGTVVLVLDWLLGPDPVHVSDVIYGDRTRQWGTTGRSAALQAPVAALIGPKTYSSGEALAYHLQSQGRAVLVGSPTPGAADHVTPIVLGTHVRGVLPEAYVRDAVTHSNWEGAGVQPDAHADDESALDVAVSRILSAP
jgi:C-terminal processing protease CtpA/Prc